MKVLTSYPVIIDKQEVSPKDYYLSADGDTNSPEKEYSVGGMIIKTNYPVILDETNLSPSDYYSSYTGAEEKSISDLMAKGSNRQEAIEILKLGADTSSDANKGKFWDKVKGVWTNVKSNPAAQYAWQQAGAYIANKGQFGGGGGGGGDYTGQQQQEQEQQAKAEADKVKAKAKTKTIKIVLISSGVIVIGLILYAVFSGNKKSK